MTRLAVCLFFFSTALCAQQDADTVRDEAPGSFQQSDVGIIAALGLSTGGGFGDLVNEEFRAQRFLQVTPSAGEAVRSDSSSAAVRSRSCIQACHSGVSTAA
jgi:hypothetical protein